MNTMDKSNGIGQTRSQLRALAREQLNRCATIAITLDAVELHDAAEQLDGMTGAELDELAERLAVDAHAHELGGNHTRAEMVWGLCTLIEELAKRRY